VPQLKSEESLEDRGDIYQSNWKGCTRQLGILDLTINDLLPNHVFTKIVLEKEVNHNRGYTPTIHQRIKITHRSTAAITINLYSSSYH